MGKPDTVEELHPLWVRRHRAGLSREQLAVAANTTAKTVYMIEHRKGRPHPNTLLALSLALGCEPAELKEAA